MLQYKDGQEAKVGDYCQFPLNRWKFCDGKREAFTIHRQGIVFAVHPEGKVSNLEVVFPEMEQRDDCKLLTLRMSYVTAAECEKVK